MPTPFGAIAVEVGPTGVRVALVPALITLPAGRVVTVPAGKFEHE